MSTQQKRTYDSSARRARADQTRARILQAAKELFSKYGVENVTIDEIAAAADVASPTVFALFRSKQGLLRALMQQTLFGERYGELVRTVSAETDPVERLRTAAAIARTIYDTEKSEMGLLRGASAFAPELKALEQEGERLRYRRQEPTIRFLAQQQRLAEGLDVARARDIFWSLTSRDFYRMLVLERGWSADAYEKWLGDTLIQSLLGAARRK